MKELYTKRLVLRALTQVEASLFLEEAEDLYEKEMYSNMLDGIRIDPDNTQWYTCMVIYLKPDTRIGAMGFQGPPAPDANIAINCFIKPEYRGFGYGAEALKAMCDYAVKSNVIKTMTTTYSMHELDKQDMVEKCGFKLIYDGVDHKTWEWERPEQKSFLLPAVVIGAILGIAVGLIAGKWLYGIIIGAILGFAAGTIIDRTLKTKFEDGIKSIKPLPAEIHMKRALKYLEYHPDHSAEMTEMLKSGNADLIYAAGGGVAIRERSSEMYVISADNEAMCDRILRFIPNGRIFHVLQKHCIAPIEKKFGKKLCTEQYLYYYAGEGRPEVSGKYEIAPMTEEFAGEVMKNSAEASRRDYVLGRISGGEMFCAKENGEVLGYIGSHDDNSIGFLFVYPEHRRKGVATELEAFMINRIMDKGIKVPFCRVNTGNEAAEGLQTKLNMKTSGYPVYSLE